jgi:hypothetical protein
VHKEQQQIWQGWNDRAPCALDTTLVRVLYNGMLDTCEATGAQEGIGVGHPLMAPGGTSWRGEVATKRSFELVGSSRLKASFVTALECHLGKGLV